MRKRRISPFPSTLTMTPIVVEVRLSEEIAPLDPAPAEPPQDDHSSSRRPCEAMEPLVKSS